MAFVTVFKRYEVKFLITREQQKRILLAMEPYMKADAYGRTTIRNLYFDTERYLLIRRSIEKPIYKEKLRVRSYRRATPDSTVFVELKKKYNHVVYKRRIALSQREAEMWLEGGTISLVASDDGLNAAGGNDQSGTTGGRDGMFGAPGGMGGGPGGRGGAGGMSSSSNGSIVISGGTLKVQASGDGIDANGTLEITGGHTTVMGPTQGDTATLDYDKSATISGGTFIGTGGAGMAQSFSQSGQGVIAVNVGNAASNTAITLKDGSKTLLNHTPSLPFAVVIFSSPDIQSGKSYTLTIGSNSAPVTAQ